MHIALYSPHVNQKILTTMPWACLKPKDRDVDASPISPRDLDLILSVSEILFLKKPVQAQYNRDLRFLIAARAHLWKDLIFECTTRALSACFSPNCLPEKAKRSDDVVDLVHSAFFVQSLSKTPQSFGFDNSPSPAGVYMLLRPAGYKDLQISLGPTSNTSLFCHAFQKENQFTKADREDETSGRCREDAPICILHASAAIQSCVSESLPLGG
ncbi:hypothetical protein F5146DRAFT_56084 [Armillaria mellea]|nr:hypothetical protein F5146DRAFT_56084 [Armillaria mellea]